MDEALHQLVHQQEMVIHMLRERLMEVEMELINARCQIAYNGHVHTHDDQGAEVVTGGSTQPG